MSNRNATQPKPDKNNSNIEWQTRFRISLINNFRRLLLGFSGLVITAIGGIGSAKIYNQNQVIQEQNQRIMNLENKVNKLSESNINKPSDKLFTLQGKLVDNNGKSLPYTEVYLIPATGSEHMTNTDAHGVFSFDKIPSPSVWFIVREKNKISSRILINKPIQNQDTPINEATVRYSLSKEQ